MKKTIKTLWEENPNSYEDKKLHQILGFCGNGKLTDNSSTSIEFKELLSNLPTTKLETYINECLAESGENAHKALQDLVNEIGVRLGFTVEFGLYKGKKGSVGNDGLWESQDSAIIVETKTTNVYSINLDTIAEYRKKLIAGGKINENDSSILLIIGRDDTGGLEAQIRGSKHAWDIRLISAEALLKLLKIKEDLVDNENTFKQISQILKPLEFTRLDYLIDTIFTTGEDVKYSNDENNLIVDEDTERRNNANETKATPVNFNDACIKRIQKHLNITVKKQTRTLYANKESDMAIICAVSKNHGTTEKPEYWFAFHPHQKESLTKYKNAYVAFGCGDDSAIFVFEFEEFISFTNDMWETNNGHRMYWHVKIRKEKGKYILRRRNKAHVDITDKIMRA
ncbi:MAG: hypothetical protein FWE06_00090 [Oscillospiraceae bacterium]|nr:hypothetical protein [Oscillospiraceae bacterium]